MPHPYKVLFWNAHEPICRFVIFALIIASHANATLFAVSPDVVVLDSQGHGRITILNPSKIPLHYSIEGISEVISGYVMPTKGDEIWITPQLDSVLVQFEGGEDYGMSELELEVVRPTRNLWYPVVTAGFILLAIALATKIYIVR